MTNGGTEGVAQYFLKNHTDLNIRIRTLKVLPGVTKKNPDFMKESNWNDTHTHSPGHTHTYHCVTDTYRLSILIDKTTLFIDSWLIRL